MATPIQIESFPDGRVDTKNAAKFLGVSTRTLDNWRYLGEGPKFIKRGRIFYYMDDLNHWLNAHGRFQSTTQARLAEVNLD